MAIELKMHHGKDKAREKQAPFRESDAGLNPRTQGSRPEPNEGRHSATEPLRRPRPHFFVDSANVCERM